MLIPHQERFEDLQKLSEILIDEISTANKMLKETNLDENFKTRILVKTIFSCIEAYVSHLKQSALLFSLPPRRNTFSHAEVLALEGKENFVKSDGTIGYRKMKLGLKPNMQIAFSAYAKALDRNYKIDFGNQGGQDFLMAVKIRDRITHPKSAGDLQLTKADAKLAIAAWTWFGEHLVAVSKLD